ncbi:MAG: tRNA (adenosine(37)-N6)-dimethylallyltransferase MiaA [Lachnospiraceae bacterium]|nr:tRNA (adenosine(37)-N6)-dimethylallyltransferase MiaA [Lachnospiraceae bacterium]
MNKKPIVILTGPTAVGKTALSIALAKRIGGAVISADSMQVYKYMDIGSAKIKKEEMDDIPHHLIDVLAPEEEFNVVRFQQLAKESLIDIYEKGHIPIIVGGTGFYIQALLYDIDFSAEEDHLEIRKRLESEAATIGGPEALHQRLNSVDPVSAAAIHPNNHKRVIRALEFWELHGSPISQHNEQQRQRTSPYAFCYFVLTDDRARLYEKIEARVDEMLSEGLVDEVSKLKAMGCHKGMVSMQGLGYKEILNYLEGSCTLEEAVYQIKRDTRHFAKRQLTWFGREKDVLWINKKDYDYSDLKILEYMESCIDAL